MSAPDDTLAARLRAAVPADLAAPGLFADVAAGVRRRTLRRRAVAVAGSTAAIGLTVAVFATTATSVDSAPATDHHDVPVPACPAQVTSADGGPRSESLHVDKGPAVAVLCQYGLTRTGELPTGKTVVATGGGLRTLVRELDAALGGQQIRCYDTLAARDMLVIRYSDGRPDLLLEVDWNGCHTVAGAGGLIPIPPSLDRMVAVLDPEDQSG